MDVSGALSNMPFVIPDCRASGKSGIHNHNPSRMGGDSGLWIPGSQLRRAPE
jgi:hypothetical protein